MNTNVFELAAAYRALAGAVKEQVAMGAQAVVGPREFRRLFVPIGPRRCRGAGKNPKRGFKMFAMHASDVLKLLYWAYDRFSCEGAVVVWCAGGGTGTLVGPYIAANLAYRLRPLAYRRGMEAGTALLPIMTLPLRIPGTQDTRNAQLSLINILKYQRKEPSHHPLVFDLEIIAQQLGLSMKKLPERAIYEECDRRVAVTLATLLKCLENRALSDPSWDWVDLYDVLAQAPKGSLGALLYISYDRLEDLEKRWKRDLWPSMTLWGQSMAGGTGTLFLVGAGITKKTHEDMSKAMRKRLALTRLISPHLEIGNKWEALGLYWGVDARTIQPPLEASRR